MLATGGGRRGLPGSRSTYGMRRQFRTAALLGCVALVAGCASMPSSGEVSKVGSEQHDDADSQVRVYGVKPQKGEQAADIVSGFLEATTSNEADYDTAREYLAKGIKKTWQPNEKITVLSGGADQSIDAGSTDRSTSVSLSGTTVAAVDSRHAYLPVAGDFSARIHLSKERGEWRIDRVPDGLVLSEADFQRLYQSVDIYYYASLGQDADEGGSSRDVLVADPVYLRSQVNLLQSTVDSLLSGPTDWLDPVAGSAFPAGTKAKKLSLDDSQHLTVRLSKSPGGEASACRLMAAQLMNTVQGVASLPVTSVDLQRPDGAAACSLSQQQAADYAPDRVAGSLTQQYFIDTGHRLVGLYGNATAAEQVPGPLGAGQVDLGSVAVRRDETYAAGVKADGSALYVTALTTDAQLGQPVLKSSAHSRRWLSAPSWDGYNDLWVADRNPAEPRLLMLRNGAGTPVEVSVPDLVGLDARIESLRVAADGVRIAMLVTEGGRTTLRLGRIERGGTQAQPELTVTALRQVTPYLEDVKAASWAGVSRLVVVGQESGGVQQIQYVGVDGSTSDDTTLPGISGVTSVAASEDQDKPLLAGLADGIFRLPTDANWKAVTPKGTSPVYPG